MKAFADLFEALDSTTKTNVKVAAMKDYFVDAPAEDSAWGVYFLSGNKLRQILPTKLLRQWAAEEAKVPLWLLEESYHSVGDLAETLSLIIPSGQSANGESLASWIENRLKPLKGMDEADQKTAMQSIWRETTCRERLVVMKLITGAFRVGVSRGLVTRAVGLASGVSPEVIAHRLMGHWEPSERFYRRLVDPDVQDTVASRPYPFCLAHPIPADKAVSTLGDIEHFSAEWKWDGIRGQVIRRAGATFLWSRGEELMEQRWPEIEAAAKSLPDGTVLDGEILACTLDGNVLPFGQLQRRIGRKSVGKRLLQEVPVVFYAFDLLEQDGQDIRSLAFSKRRERLNQMFETFNHPHLRATEMIRADEWEDWEQIRQTSREQNAEGLMIKRLDAPYDVGRVRGTWWKWKVTPHTIDAVLIYAQKGHGKRASLFTDYTFAVWKDGKLVPFAKAYSGLDDAEIRQVDRFIRENTQDKFGPVRSVIPQLVMELAFEGIQRSKRHKSGVATRFPRIVRWRKDKRPEQANTLDDLLELLPE